MVHSRVTYVMLQTRELERDVKLQLKVVCHIFQVEVRIRWRAGYLVEEGVLCWKVENLKEENHGHLV